MTNIEQLEAAGDNLEGLAVQRLGVDPWRWGALSWRCATCHAGL